MINELYTINAWNRLAEWAVQMLQSGMHVYVKGYLTQRTQQNGPLTEVTAKLLCSGRKVALLISNNCA